MYYFDANGTAPPIASLGELMAPFLGSEFGNPSSDFHTLGASSRAAIERAREEVALLVDAEPEEVVFTSGATESIWQALCGLLLSQSPKKHFISSQVEHTAVHEALRTLARLCDVKSSLLAVSEKGEICATELFQALQMDTAGVSLIYGNNETGIIFSLDEISKSLRDRGAPLHLDAVQAVGKIPLSFRELGADLMSTSAHKFGGPKGIGALVIRKGTPWEAVLQGGGQEHGRRGGTENVAGIVGMGEAARQRRTALKNGLCEELEVHRNLFEELLKDSIPGAFIVGESSQRLPNTSCFILEGVSGNRLVVNLARRGIILASGSACNSKNFEPSRVLTAMGFSKLEALSMLRVSLAPGGSGEQIRILVKAIREESRELYENSLKEVHQRLR